MAVWWFGGTQGLTGNSTIVNVSVSHCSIPHSKPTHPCCIPCLPKQQEMRLQMKLSLPPSLPGINVTHVCSPHTQVWYVSLSSAAGVGGGREHGEHCLSGHGYSRLLLSHLSPSPSQSSVLWDAWACKRLFCVAGNEEGHVMGAVRICCWARLFPVTAAFPSPSC